MADESLQNRVALGWSGSERYLTQELVVPPENATTLESVFVKSRSSWSKSTVTSEKMNTDPVAELELTVVDGTLENSLKEKKKSWAETNVGLLAITRAAATGNLLSMVIL